MWTPLRIAGLYALVGIVWILLSDWMLRALFQLDADAITYVQTAKGWFFIFATAGLIFLLVRRGMADQKRANAALAQSEASHRRLIETAEEGIWIVDAAGVTTFVNTRMAQLLDYAPEQLIGETAVDFMDAALRPTFYEHLERRRRGIREQYDTCLIRRDGSKLWVLVSSNPITDEQGDFLGTLAMLTDITRRKMAEQALRESDERLRAIFEEAGIGIALIDPEAHFIEVNRAMAEVLGYSVSEMIGMSLVEVIPPSERPSAMEVVQRIFADKATRSQIERTYLRKDGQLVWVRRTATAVCDADGRITGAVFMLEDITARKRAEDELRQLNENLERRVAQRTAELAAANEALDAFSYSVSQALRLPLHSLRGLGQALLAEDATELSAAGQERARRIVALSARMDRHIQDLLAYARVAAGPMDPERVSLILAVTQVLGQLEQEIADRGAQVIVEEPLPWVHGHRLTLEGIIVSLLNNALRYTKAGEAPRVRLRAERRDGHVRLWVEDQGPGIAPADQQRIFELFTRLGEETESAGMGIGLAIVCRGVQRMGGSCGIESQVGKGSRFWIELPVA